MLNADQRKARDNARKALEHCGVIRVTLGQVPLGYRLLQREGAVSARRVPGLPDKADVRLKEDRK